jgi:hypothetical protein
MSLVIIGDTVTAPLTSAATTWQVDSSTPDVGETTPQSWRVRLWGDQDFHVAVAATSKDATTSDMPVAAKYDGVEVVVPPNGWISLISAGIDGTFFATRVKRA